ncbi:MAG: DUF6602 domain-containing protein [Burkholderiales bacterium]
MLLAFMEAERRKLAEYDLKHGPSIGDMYEGLSSKLLDMAIPVADQLRVVSGFIVDAAGKMSGQIDCMLVIGTGEQIPFSSAHKWPVWDVLAVVEVKKNLYGADLKDSFVHLSQVAQSFSTWLFAEGDGERKFHIDQALKAFETITGHVAPRYQKREQLPESLQLAYHTLIVEQLSPLLIVLGYEGYKSEQSLREGMWKFLEERGAGRGIGVQSFPHQITCNGNSLVKLNGQPYMEPMTGNDWTFYASTTANPLRIMVELIWTKIANRFRIEMPWGDDLDVEVFRRLLTAEGRINEHEAGWMLAYTSMNPKVETTAQFIDWEPTVVSLSQFVVFQRLCSEGELDTMAQDFVEFVRNAGQTVDDFITQLRSTGFVATDGHLLKLTTTSLVTAIVPDKGYVVAENNTGRLTRFVHKRLMGNG